MLECAICGKEYKDGGHPDADICDECMEEGYGVCKGCGNYAMLEDQYCEDCIEDGCYCDDEEEEDEDDEEDDGEY